MLSAIRPTLAGVLLVVVLMLQACSSSSGTTGTGTPGTGTPGTGTPGTGTTGTGTTGTGTKGQSWQGVLLPARVRAVVQRGDESAIHIVRTITKPFEGCARPNAYGWTTATGRQLAADALAWFVDHMPSDPNCSAFLYLFHDASQTGRSGFNAGAVIYDGGLLDVDVGSPIDGPTYEFNVS